MKKVVVSICIVCVALVIFSCRSVEKVELRLSSLNGEWNIVEVNGAKILPGEAKTLPFINFDTSAGKFFGNCGCNRMMGGFDINSKSGSIDLGQIATTRMMCPDMTVERNVLGVLAQVKGYKKAGKDKMYLCNATNHPIVLLEKKSVEVNVSALDGKWFVKEVNGTAIPSKMEKHPFIQFDVQNQTIHGNSGCNLMNGGFVTKEDDAKAISFPGIASTMMACPDMEVESKVLKAISEVASFDVLPNKNIGLYNADKALVMVLSQK